MKVGFIFDLDNTIVNTDCAKQYRNSGNFFQAYQPNMLEKMIPATEIIKCIKTLIDFGFDVAIVSNSPSNYGNAILKYFGLDDTRFIKKFYHDVKKHKPDSEPFLEAVKEMNGDTKYIICVGDDSNDIIACENATKEDKSHFYFAIMAAWFVNPYAYFCENSDYHQAFRVCRSCEDFCLMVELLCDISLETVLRERENRIFYYLDYYTTGKDANGKPKKHDVFSKIFVYKVKNEIDYKVPSYSELIYDIKKRFFMSLINTLNKNNFDLSDTGFVVIPSSQRDKWNSFLQNGIKEYIIPLGGIDMSKLISRSKERKSQSKGGDRNYVNNMATMEIKTDIPNIKNIVVLDDFVTSDNSMHACMELLRIKGYKGRLIGIAVGATYRYSKYMNNSLWYDDMNDYYLKCDKNYQKNEFVVNNVQYSENTKKIQEDILLFLYDIWKKQELETKKEKEERENLEEKYSIRNQAIRMFEIKECLKKNEASFQIAKAGEENSFYKKIMSLDWKYIIDDLLGSDTICKKIQGLKENPKESHREKIDSCKKILTADWKFNIDDLLNSDVSYDNLFSSIEYKYTSMNIKSILNNTCQKTEDIYVEAQKYKDVDNEKRHQLLLYAAECGISKAYLDIANELIDDKNVNSNSYNRQKRWIDAAIREGETSICRYLHRLEYTYNHNTNMERDKSYYRKLIFSGLDKSMLRGLENENIFAIQKFYDYLDIVDKKLFIEEKYYNCYIGRLKIGILTRLLQYDKNNNDYMLKLAQIYLTVFEDYLSYSNWIDKAIENGNICASVNKMLNADRKYLTVESHTYEDNIFQEIALWYSASAEEYYDPNEAFNYGMSIRKTSPKEAHDLLLYASECGLTKAYYYVGMNYGSGIDKDINIQKKWLIEAAKTNNIDAENQLAQMGYYVSFCTEEFKITDLYCMKNGAALLNGILIDDLYAINSAIILFSSIRAKYQKREEYNKFYFSSLLIGLYLKKYRLTKDADTAYIIANEYLMSFDDVNRCKQWLVQAYKLGNKEAEYSLAVCYFFEDDRIYNQSINRLVNNNINV